jgi:hypothetical protein
MRDAGFGLARRRAPGKRGTGPSGELRALILLSSMQIDKLENPTLLLACPGIPCVYTCPPTQKVDWFSGAGLAGGVCAEPVPSQSASPGRQQAATRSEQAPAGRGNARGP